MDRDAHGQVQTEVFDHRLLVVNVDRVEKKNAFTPEISNELAAAYTRLGDDPDWPLLLSAGERRSFTANTIPRDPALRKNDPDGSLRVSPADSDTLGLLDGDTATLTTKRASVAVTAPARLERVPA